MGNQANCQSPCQGFQSKVNQIYVASQDNTNLHLKPITFQDTIAPFQALNQQKYKGNDRHQKYFDTQNQKLRNQQISSIDKISNCKQEGIYLKEQQKVYDCASPQRKVQFKMQEMVIINAFSDQITQGKIKYEPILAPFSVIKISLSKIIINGINQVDSTFFLKYQNDNKSFKLYKQGFYAQILNQKYGIFLNSNYFYQGQVGFQKQKQIYFPEGKGVFINQIGKYYGQFINGKANKKGKLFQFKNKTLYEGTWSNGKLTDGNITCDDFIYEGQIKNNQPNGKGNTVFLKENISYKGNFLNGKFQDQKAMYQCQQYKYVGGFKNGKKNGRGKLEQKIKNTNSKNNLSNNPETFDGIWSQDLIIPGVHGQTKKIK